MVSFFAIAVIILFYFIPVADTNDDVEFTRLRNGVNTNTQNHNEQFTNEAYTAFMQRRMNSVSFNRGLHETMEYYDDCTKRERNMCEYGEGRKLVAACTGGHRTPWHFYLCPVVVQLDDHS